MKKSCSGFTLLEMTIGMTLMIIIILMVSPMMDITFKGFQTLEIYNALKSTNQTAINKLGRTLSGCYRLFQNTANDNDYLDQIDLGGLPGKLAGSRLPQVQSVATLSPNEAGYDDNMAGNSLFFVSLLPPEEVDLDGTIRRIDIYQLHYYYLGEGSQKDIADKKNRTLWEWHSIKYASHDSLQEITNDEQRENAVEELTNLGYEFSFNASAATVDAAFYNWETDTWVEVLDDDHTIQRARGDNMIQIKTGKNRG